MFRNLTILSICFLALPTMSARPLVPENAVLLPDEEEDLMGVFNTNPLQNFGPLSFGLSELPPQVNGTFVLSGGFPTGGGATGYGLDEVISANLVFGDVIGPNNLMEFDLEIDADGSIEAFSYTFAPFDTPTVSQGVIAMNGIFEVTGTDIASGQPFSYTYADSTATVDPIPDSFLVTRGVHVSGGVLELAASDNTDLSIRRATSDTLSRTEFEVKEVSPVASPTSLEVTLEGSVFARTQVNQTIELFDYVANAWEQIDVRAATRFTDSTVTVAATGDLSRFVEAGTLCMTARIRYQSPVARQQFSSNTDQFFWTIGQ